MHVYIYLDTLIHISTHIYLLILSIGWGIILGGAELLIVPIYPTVLLGGHLVLIIPLPSVSPLTAVRRRLLLLIILAIILISIILISVILVSIILVSVVLSGEITVLVRGWGSWDCTAQVLSDFQIQYD